jgi:hypothetical protein
MWAKKGADQDALFESGVEWFSAPYNMPSMTKPKKIKDWEGGQTCCDVTSKDVRWSKPRAEKKQLQDLPDVALDYTLDIAKAKQTFTAGVKGENLPPAVFHADRDGTCDGEIIILRALIDKAGDRDVKAQDAQVDKWLKDKASSVDDDASALLKQACELTDSEMIYVRELVRVHDLVRCCVVTWVVDAPFKNHINSERTVAVYSGKDHTWARAQECILKTLVDISPEARLARFASHKRPSSETTILFLARRITERSMMEGPHVPRKSLPATSATNYRTPSATHSTPPLVPTTISTA